MPESITGTVTDGREGGDSTPPRRRGVTIDNIGEVEARIKEFAPNTDIRKEEGGLFHGDFRVTDPSGQSLTLSTHQFHTPIVERTFPCIRHLAMCVLNNDDVLDFYVNIFGIVAYHLFDRQVHERG